MFVCLFLYGEWGLLCIGFDCLAWRDRVFPHFVFVSLHKFFWGKPLWCIQSLLLIRKICIIIRHCVTMHLSICCCFFGTGTVVSLLYLKLHENWMDLSCYAVTLINKDRSVKKNITRVIHTDFYSMAISIHAFVD